LIVDKTYQRLILKWGLVHGAMPFEIRQAV
jgi:hypothetical protein